MGLSVIVDVAIGLIFMYLVLSLICTTINELAATVLKLRARALFKTVTKLIDNPNVRKAFYDHGLISNASVSSSGGKTTPDQPSASDHPSYFGGRTFAMALLGSVDPDNPNPLPPINEINTAIEKLPVSNIRDVLMANLATAGNDIAKLRDNVAEWYDTSMDRLSGEYKRKIKWISFGVGFALALLINADSLKVGQAIWNDQSLRTQVVNSAGEALKGSLPKCDQQDPAKAIECQVGLINKLGQDLRPLPIGWPDTPPADTSGGSWLWWWMLKIFGCLFTGIALSLGAPFWFDLLEKFMNVRGAGTKPTKEKETTESTGTRPAAATK